MAVLPKLLLISLLLISTFAAQESQKNAKELVFTMLVTRHGARSPTLDVPEGATISSDEWEITLGTIRFPYFLISSIFLTFSDLGDLTQSGERQHFLEGTGLKKAYGQDGGLIPQTFNPKEFVVMSTDFNRTIMSAYSQLLGYYPLGSIPDLTKDQTARARPPFSFTGM